MEMWKQFLVENWLVLLEWFRFQFGSLSVFVAPIGKRVYLHLRYQNVLSVISKIFTMHFSSTNYESGFNANFFATQFRKLLFDSDSVHRSFSKFSYIRFHDFYRFHLIFGSPWWACCHFVCSIRTELSLRFIIAFIFLQFLMISRLLISCEWVKCSTHIIYYMNKHHR